MAENLTTTTARVSINDLRKIEVFADLPMDQLAWLVDHFQEMRFQPGEVMGREGEPLDYLTVILEGEIRIQRGGGADGPVFRGFAGQVTGLLPYSRLTHYGGTSQAVLPTRIALLHRSLFPELLERMPLLGQRLVSIMADRIRETTRIETQRDKLMALGKLSAGLAHELNNPAAAAQRATASLRETLETVRDASIRLARHALSPGQRELITRFEREAGQTPTNSADPLAQGDREERITTWLEARHVQDAWKIAPAIADAGVEIPKLESLAGQVGEEVVGDALTRIASLLTIARLINEIEISTKRISDLVGAIKEYSYMDQSAMKEVDLRQGLENTLTILHHKLKAGVNVVREYDANLPKICAYGGELNQIWTNLFVNAIEAMHGKGELRVRTAREIDRVLVEIGDNGPGIPPDVLPHIFDPFFTTKGVGEGTGLGLDTVCRIIRNHHGEIRVTSHPGDTRFQVYLPITQPKTPSSTA
ncbi:MAG: ATP-binding protein [Acidobacteriota bacterium]|nr:ATP-binding protein [Acidobacteriota bacterium]